MPEEMSDIQADLYAVSNEGRAEAQGDPIPEGDQAPEGEEYEATPGEEVQDPDDSYEYEYRISEGRAQAFEKENQELKAAVSRLLQERGARGPQQAPEAPEIPNFDTDPKGNIAAQFKQINDTLAQDRSDRQGQQRQADQNNTVAEFDKAVDADLTQASEVDVVFRPMLEDYVANKIDNHVRLGATRDQAISAAHSELAREAQVARSRGDNVAEFYMQGMEASGMDPREYAHWMGLTQEQPQETRGQDLARQREVPPSRGAPVGSMGINVDALSRMSTLDVRKRLAEEGFPRDRSGNAGSPIDSPFFNSLFAEVATPTR